MDMGTNTAASLDTLDMDPAIAAENAALAEQQAAERLDAIGARLQTLAEEQVRKREPIERRWLDDLRQFNGQYDEETRASIEAAGGSRAFVNLTRPKVNTMEARLADILLPTDDQNWGIEPTPEPQLELYRDDIAKVLGKLQQRGMTPEQLTPQLAKQIVEVVAEERCRAMEGEIADQLAECNYSAVCRDVLHDGALLGTGILKGPVVHNRQTTRWEVVSDGQRTMHVGRVVEELKPTAVRVSPWNFFPDMSALTIDDADFIFERDYLTKRQLRKLAKNKAYLKGQIRKVLESTEDPKVTAQHFDQLRSMAGLDGVDSHRYELWEYHGPIEREEWIAAGLPLPENSDEVLDSLDAIIWFVDGTVIRAVLNPLESQERPYSVFVLERSDISLFGYGVPHGMRSSQRVANAAWRMLLDNAGLSAGPQGVIDDQMIEPLDGVWGLSPRKLWRRRADAVGQYDPRLAFYFFDVPNAVNELMTLFTTALRLIDEETAMPQIASGQQGEASKTAQGMTILINAANTVLRRIVKSFDDDVTKTLIPRWYNWNMQFSERQDIKGDFSIVARGTAALMEKDSQIDALLKAMQIAAANPIMAQRTKFDELQRELFRLMRVDPDKFLLSEDEVRRLNEAPKESGTPPEMQVKMAELQLKQQDLQGKQAESQQRNQLAAAELQFEAQVHQDEMQLEQMKLAAAENTTMNKLQADVGLERFKADNENRRFNTETALKVQTGSGI